jgi:hypothetical protein
VFLVTDKLRKVKEDKEKGNGASDAERSIS